MNEKTLFHLGIPTSVRAEYALIPGDPGRVPLIAEHIENARPLAYNREYNSYIGKIAGADVIVCSTGIGGPSAAIAVEELHMLGVRTFIRIGTCGGMQTDILSGELIVATAAVRAEGTALHYAPAEYPAAADFEVTAALVGAARELSLPYRAGVVHCKDSFYGQHSPERSPVSYSLINAWEAYKRLGVLASEMESATLYSMAAALGVRAGCVLNCLWNQEREAAGLPNPICEDMDRAVRCAVRAVEMLVMNSSKS